jgi:hypothetical protein
MKISCPVNYNSLSDNDNLTWTIIKNNPNKNWNWTKISSHHNITMDIIEQNPDDSIAPGCPKWDYYGIVLNPNVTFDFILKNHNKIVTWHVVYNRTVYNYVITEKDLINNIDWEYKQLSRNRNLGNYIKNNPEKPWDWNLVANHMNIKDLESLKPELFETDIPEFWINISSNETITVNFINKYKHKPLSWTKINMNDGLKMEDLERIPTLIWAYLDGNSNFNSDFLMKNLSSFEIYGEWNTISEHENITMEFIADHSELPWNPNNVINNPNVTLDYIKEAQFAQFDYNESFTWLMDRLSKHPVVTMEFIESGHFAFTQRGISENPNLLPVTYNCYKKYKKYKHYPLVQKYETKIISLFDSLCDDLLNIIIDLI